MPGIGTGLLARNSILQSRYVIVDKLGRGGMGATYKVVDQRLGGKVLALKEMSDAAITDPQERVQAIDAFRQEAQLLACLNHPNIPKVTDSFTENYKHYIVMEFVPGETLDDRMARRGVPCSEQEVRQWALQLCEVLSYLHSQSPPIIFRDMKPGNIMITPHGQLKLIDFGIARLFKAGKKWDTQAIGTVGYAAPEQYGKGQTDARSDIYSLGVTLHHLLTGHHPSMTPFNLPPVRRLNPTVSSHMEAVIQKATRAQSEDRFQSAAEMRQALHSGVPRPSLVPVPVQQPSPQPPPSIPAKTRVSLSTRHLDFGTVLPGRIRWQLLVVNSRNATEKIEFAPNKGWITVRPSDFTCRRGERRRVGVRVKTSELPVDSVHDGELVLTSTTGEERIPVRVEVESIPVGRSILVSLVNMVVGTVLGLIAVGMLGNLALWLLRRHLDISPVIYGALAGGLILTLIGLRIQDSLNLSISLGVGMLSGAALGFGVGLLLGLGLGYLLGNWTMLSLFAGVSLLVGELAGAAYVCMHPEKWIGQS